MTGEPVMTDLDAAVMRGIRPAAAAEQPRVLFVAPKPQAGGPNRSLLLLLAGLADSYGCEVLLPGRGPVVDVLARQGVPYRVHPWLEQGRAQAVVALCRLLRRARVDLVYVNETSGLTRAVCWAAFLAGVPFISHVRSMCWRHGRTTLGHLALAAAVIAVSRASAASVQRFVRPGRLQVVHNGVPLPPIPSDRDAARHALKQELGLPPEARIIISVGSVSPRKGQVHQLEAMANLARAEPHAHLVVAGGSRDRHAAYAERVRSMLLEPALAGRVSLLGLRTDVERLLLGSDLFLHTALADPHPRGVLEAMAAALPVVAFATDGVAETVQHGRTGYLLQPGDAAGAADALRRLLHDPATARAMGEAGRERAEREFPEAHTTEAVRKIVEQALRRSRSGLRRSARTTPQEQGSRSTPERLMDAR
jgi:glycosyltransferase involved in cell wall biosynthesis